MSELLTIMAAVIATPVPTPSPQIVTVIKEVAVTPEWVNQLGAILKTTAQIGLLVVPGYFASFLQSVANSKIALGKWANASILFGYSVVLGTLTLIATDALNLTTLTLTPESIGGAVLIVLGAASARYAIVKDHYAKKEAAPATEATAAF